MKKVFILAGIALSMLAFSCTSFSLMIRPPRFHRGERNAAKHQSGDHIGAAFMG